MLGKHLVWMLLIIILEVLSDRGATAEFKIDQKDYNITVERIEVNRYDKVYINHIDIKTFKYNRTCAAFNMSLNINFEMNKLEVIVQAYKFLSNEYRLFPLRVQYNVCKAFNQNFAGLGKYSCGNFTGCSTEKGKNYRMCNWTIDQSKFPPRMPTGHYMLEFQYLYYEHDIAFGRAYGIVSRSEV